MNFSYLFEPEQILTDVKVKDKWELFDRMLEAISHNRSFQEVPESVRAGFRDCIIEREQDISTGLGEGVAFPHARIAELNRVFVAIAILAEPIEYDSPDGQPVQFAFMALLPETKPTLGVKIMSTCTTLIRDQETRQYLAQEKDPNRIYEFLDQQEVSIDTPISAGDLMSPEKVSISPDTPLRRVSRIMQEQHSEAQAVLDENHQVLGEISCNILFSREIPDYIKKLNSVPAIKNFNPFQEYFTADAKLVAENVMSTDVALVEEDATLLEVVFLLSVKMYPKIYVTRDGRLVGTIDRITVLDRLLNL